MSPEDLARAVAQSLVTVLATHVATGIKTKIIKVLSRRKPEAEIAAELEQTQATLTDNPADRVGEEYYWKRELASLLREHPDVTSELRGLLEEIQRLTPAMQEFGGINHQGSVGGDNLQVQAMGDVTIDRGVASGPRAWWRR